MTGLNPNVIRSNGVWKWRRFAAGSACGPSGGSFASEAARDVPQMFVRPSARSVNPYAAGGLDRARPALDADPCRPVHDLLDLELLHRRLCEVALVRPPQRALQALAEREPVDVWRRRLRGQA